MMQLVARTYLACGRCDSLQRADADRIELVVQGNTGYSVLAEYGDATSAWVMGDLERFFVPMGHTAFAEATPDANGNPAYGTYTYLAHDHLGTGRFAYNQAKAQVGITEHDPYGSRTYTDGYIPYHEYTGKPFDDDLGAYYFPFRYYQPFAARWLTPDPLGLVDGPNVYGYVKGNPVMYVDPTGQFIIILPLIGPIAVAGTTVLKLALGALTVYGLVTTGNAIRKLFTSDQDRAMKMFRQNQDTDPTPESRRDQVDRGIVRPMIDRIPDVYNITLPGGGTRGYTPGPRRTPCPPVKKAPQIYHSGMPMRVY